VPVARAPSHEGQTLRAPSLEAVSVVGAAQRNRSSVSPPPAEVYTLPPWAPILEKRQSSRQRFERDSLRTRSAEGRAGSRRRRRFTHSIDVTNTLRRAMARNGEDSTNLNEQELDLEKQVLEESKPSVFYRLMEIEGPENALSALNAAEASASSRRKKSREPRSSKAPTEEQNRRKVRRAFADTWQYIQGSETARDLLKNIEAQAARAFGMENLKESALAMLWMLTWDDDARELETKLGSPPTAEMVIGGLDPILRKVTHQLATVLDLHSESRTVTGDDKVVALRPFRRHNCDSTERWAPACSVAQVVQ